MALEIVFGTGLGDLTQSAEMTVLSYRSDIEPNAWSLQALAESLHEILSGMARDSSDFILAPEGQEFYFLAIVRPPTLGLELPKQVMFTVRRMHHLSPHEQIREPAKRIAEQLADLGTPSWIDSTQPRQPERVESIAPFR